MRAMNLSVQVQLLSCILLVCQAHLVHSRFGAVVPNLSGQPKGTSKETMVSMRNFENNDCFIKPCWKWTQGPMISLGVGFLIGTLLQLISVSEAVKRVIDQIPGRNYLSFLPTASPLKTEMPLTTVPTEEPKTTSMPSRISMWVWVLAVAFIILLGVVIAHYAMYGHIDLANLFVPASKIKSGSKKKNKKSTKSKSNSKKAISGNEGGEALLDQALAIEPTEATTQQQTSPMLKKKKKKRSKSRTSDYTASMGSSEKQLKISSPIGVDLQIPAQTSMLFQVNPPETSTQSMLPFPSPTTDINAASPSNEANADKKKKKKSRRQRSVAGSQWQQPSSPQMAAWPAGSPVPLRPQVQPQLPQPGQWPQTVAFTPPAPSINQWQPVPSVQTQTAQWPQSVVVQQTQIDPNMAQSVKKEKKKKKSKSLQEKPN